MPQPLRANIHHYEPHPITGEYHRDEDGEPLLGYYYEITDLNGIPLGLPMGPYGTPAECEQACAAAYRRGDY